MFNAYIYIYVYYSSALVPTKIEHFSLAPTKFLHASSPQVSRRLLSARIDLTPRDHQEVKGHDTGAFIWLLSLIMMCCIRLTVFVNALLFPEKSSRL